MPPQDRFKLKKTAAIAAIISALLPASAYGTAGRVDFAYGDVQAVSSDGSKRALTKGSPVMSGDTIRITRGRAHIRFSDGAYVSLKPDTEFKVEDYSFEQDNPRNRGFFSLLRGGFRTITGLIGRKNTNAYRMRTPIATIGIRGTHYSVDVGAPKGTAQQPAAAGKKTVVGDVLNFLDSNQIVLQINPQFRIDEGSGATVTKTEDPQQGETTYVIETFDITTQEGGAIEKDYSGGKKYKVVVKAGGGVDLFIWDPASGQWGSRTDEGEFTTDPYDLSQDEKTSLEEGAAAASFSTDLQDDNPTIQDITDEVQDFIDQAAAYGGGI